MSDFEIKICFRKNKSKYYDYAIETAQNFKSFKAGNLNIVTVDKKVLLDNIDKVYYLCSLINRWKDSKLYLNGEKVNFHYLHRQIIGIDCYYGYKQEVIQEIYCWHDKNRPGWGCKQLEEIKKHYNKTDDEFRRFIYWFEIGHFITDITWRIDKKEIIRLLKREAELKHLDLCPIFDFEKIVAAVNELPEEIDLTDEWEIKYTHEPGYEPKPVGIRPKIIFDE